ncbi:MAG: class I SAM-dependent methyltransferase [Mucilaginibacter sp.]|uniref:class I SAM-dependent methyltransferase n=1 Tax=Mucilaginibacter sp. TaxID=1882438 RepID=UPI003267F579
MQLINNTVQHTNCPICAASGIQRVGNVDYLTPLRFSTTEIQLTNKPELYHCTQCLSGFIQNAVPEATAMELYANSVSGERWKAAPFRQMKTPNVVQALLDIFPARSHVLDVGCNTGELLDLAKENGCITYGNELSAESQKILLAKGHKVCLNLSEIEDGSLDVIAAFDLVEHLYDMPGFLKFCKSKLKKDGRMVILTGNIRSKSARWAGSNWWYLKYPEHVVFAAPAFYQSLGFKVERLIHTYASVGYKRSAFARIKSLIIGKLTGKYRGLASWGPDHYLAILKND